MLWRLFLPNPPTDRNQACFLSRHAERKLGEPGRGLSREVVKNSCVTLRPYIHTTMQRPLQSVRAISQRQKAAHIHITWVGMAAGASLGFG